MAFQVLLDNGIATNDGSLINTHAIHAELDIPFFAGHNSITWATVISYIVYCMSSKCTANRALVNTVGPCISGQDVPVGMSLACKGFMVPFLSLMANNPSEPCALELASL